MSKKEKVEDKEKIDNLEQKEKSSSKKQKKKEKTKKEDLKTLIELVNESNIPRQLMIILLDENNYLNQFYEEERKLERKEIIKPSISIVEFNKIIGG